MGHPSFMVVSAKCMDPSLGVLGFAKDSAASGWRGEGERCHSISSEDQAVWLAEEVPGFAVVGVGVAASVSFRSKEQ